MKQLETETIDKLYLELSQVTRAKTNKELAYEGMLWACYYLLGRLANGEVKVEDVALKYRDDIYNTIQKYK